MVVARATTQKRLPACCLRCHEVELYCFLVLPLPEEAVSVHEQALIKEGSPELRSPRSQDAVCGDIAMAGRSHSSYR